VVARKSESILLGRQALGPAFFIGSAAEIGKNNDSRLAGENSGLERSITQARPRPAAHERHATHGTANAYHE